jgi:hypothetical protein
MQSFTEKTGEAIANALDTFTENAAKWEDGNKSAGVRARKALMEIKKLAGAAKKEMSPAASENEEKAA